MSILAKTHQKGAQTTDDPMGKTRRLEACFRLPVLNPKRGVLSFAVFGGLLEMVLNRR
jgi:hypothetical protein